MGAVKNHFHDEISGIDPEDPDVEVCSNCGGYYFVRPMQRDMRCEFCTIDAIAMAPKAETEGLRGLSPAKRGAKQSPKVSR